MMKKYIIQAFPSGEFGIDTIDEVAQKFPSKPNRGKTHVGYVSKEKYF
ncbi:MAG: hypothetical protein ACLTX3_06795 [Lachnospiraceae bacterium]